MKTGCSLSCCSITVVTLVHSLIPCIK